MKSDLNPIGTLEPRVDRITRHSETMSSHIPDCDRLADQKTDEEPKFIGTDSISKLLCHCAKESVSPRFQKKTVRNFKKMKSISKSFQEEPKSRDTPAAKGILTLFFCIVYAAAIFILAAVFSRVCSSFAKPEAIPSGVQIKLWETDSKKHMEVRQSRLVHTRWGQ